MIDLDDWFTVNCTPNSEIIITQERYGQSWREHQTLFRPVSVPIWRTTVRTSGRLRMVPSTGTRVRNTSVAGIKPRKRRRKPYDSMHMPIRGQPNKTMKMPKKNAVEALILCRWKKNQKVRSSPMMKARPEMKSRLPTASRPLSKNISTPRKRNDIPKPARPRPIFCVSVIDIIFWCFSGFCGVFKINATIL